MAVRAIITAILTLACVGWIASWVGCGGRVLIAGTGDGSPGGNLPGDWTACSGGGQCTLRADVCCAPCIGPELAHGIAVRTDHVDQLTAQLCGSTPQACPALCARGTTYTTAVCRQGDCTGIDIRSDSLSACTKDSDCGLRAGLGCCASCGPFTDAVGLVAVARSANIGSLVCPAGGAAACSPCPGPTSVPPGVVAVCTMGHCQVALPQ